MPLRPSVSYIAVLLQPIDMDLNVGPESLLSEVTLRTIMNKQTPTCFIQRNTHRTHASLIGHHSGGET
jgi:hypothetical protein